MEEAKTDRNFFYSREKSPAPEAEPAAPSHLVSEGPGRCSDPHFSPHSTLYSAQAPFLLPGVSAPGITPTPAFAIAGPSPRHPAGGAALPSLCHPSPYVRASVSPFPESDPGEGEVFKTPLGGISSGISAGKIPCANLTPCSVQRQFMRMWVRKTAQERRKSGPNHPTPI